MLLFDFIMPRNKCFKKNANKYSIFCCVLERFVIYFYPYQKSIFCCI